MTHLDLGGIEQACIDVVSSVIADYRPRLIDAALAGDLHERRNDRHQDNFLSEFDVALHGHYRTALAERLGAFVYLSEEGEPETVGGGSPDLVVVVDPLDTSELAVRALHGYTHVLVYSMAQARPLVAVVGDFFHEIDLYVGSVAGERPAAVLRTRDRRLRALTVPARQPSDRLLVTNYDMRPTERFLPLAAQRRLISLLSDPPGSPGGGPSGDRSRIGVDFGSIGCCHVASGATDAFVEFAKGFALWDLLPGRFILECAGGVVYDLDGQPLPWPTDDFADIDRMTEAMDVRQRFVAASTADLARTIAAAIDPPA